MRFGGGLRPNTKEHESPSGHERWRRAFEPHGRHGDFRVRLRRFSCLFVFAPQGMGGLGGFEAWLGRAISMKPPEGPARGRRRVLVRRFRRNRPTKPPATPRPAWGRPVCAKRGWPAEREREPRRSEFHRNRPTKPRKRLYIETAGHAPVDRQMRIRCVIILKSRRGNAIKICLPSLTRAEDMLYCALADGRVGGRLVFQDDES